MQFFQNKRHLNLNNVIFKGNYYYKEKIKGITYKIFEGYLTYKPKYCHKSGVVFDDKFEKHGFINSNMKLPEVLSFDELKSVKTEDGAMSFHMCDGVTSKTIDIIDDRRLNNLIKYFYYYDYQARIMIFKVLVKTKK